MTGGERFVVLGLAAPRAAWFAEVGRWATSAALPLEFVKCVSAEELRARLAGGRAFSAVLLDGAGVGVDRDLIDLARAGGATVLVVDDGRARRDWVALGATAVLPSTLTRTDLRDALAAHAAPIPRRAGGAVELAGTAGTPEVPPADDAGWRAPLVTVVGVPGAGTSTVAAAAAQGLGADPRWSGAVLLADLALDAHQAVLHDAGDVVPGVSELVEAHRLGQPAADEVRRLAYAVEGRGYHLLLGLRRHRDWAGLRARAVDAALVGVRRAYRLVVVDATGDLEGEDQCGSAEVEDRNLLARASTLAADLVVVVGQPGPTRVHALVRLLDAVVAHGVEPSRIVPVLNRSARSPRGRAELTRAIAELAPTASLPSPLHLPDRRGLDDVVRDGRRLPSALVGPVTTAITALLPHHGGSRREPADLDPPSSPVPVAVAPGSLGRWAGVDDPLAAPTRPE